MSADLFGQSELFAGRWPTSGMTRSGSLYPLPKSALPTAGNVSSSPPGLLPTPAAGNFNDGESLESWEARRQANLAKGINGNGQGTPLAIAARQLLPTPRPQTNGGGAAAEDPPNRQGGPNLMTAVSLLPTPRAWDEGGTEAVWEERQQAVMANGHCRSGLPLSMAVQLLPTPQEFDSHFDSLNISDEAAERQLHRTDGIRRRTTGSLTKDLLLLKTPTAQLAVNGGSQHPDKRREGGHGPTLADQVEFLLPTPQAADGSRGADVETGARRPSGAKRSENLTTTVSQLLPTPNATDGKGSAGTRGRERAGRPRKTGDANLPEALLLLPTPRAADGNGNGRSASSREGSPSLTDCLLPTPAARDWKSGQSHVMDRNARPLNEVVEMLLPTPRATDGTKGGPNQHGSSGDLMLPSAVMDFLPTPRATRGGSGTETMYSLGGERTDTGRPQGEVLLPTPTAGDSKASGSRNLPGSKAHPGVSLTDAIQTGGSTTPRQSHGATTSQPSAAGKPSSDGQHPGQLSLDGLENA
jgi:hypothetical protein